MPRNKNVPLFRNSEGKIVPAPWGYPGNDEFRAPVVQRRKVVSVSRAEQRFRLGWTLDRNGWTPPRTVVEHRAYLRIVKEEEARILAELDREDERV